MTRCIVYRFINGPVDRVARVPGASPVIHTSKFDIKIEVNSENVCKVDKRGISDRMIRPDGSNFAPPIKWGTKPVGIGQSSDSAYGETLISYSRSRAPEGIVILAPPLSVTEPPLGPIVLFSITGEVGLVSLCICQ